MFRLKFVLPTLQNPDVEYELVPTPCASARLITRIMTHYYNVMRYILYINILIMSVYDIHVYKPICKYSYYLNAPVLP